MAGLIEYVRGVRDSRKLSESPARETRALPRITPIAEKHARSIDSVLRFWLKHQLGIRAIGELRTMARHPHRASESSRLRIVFCSVLFIAATIAVVGGTGSSRAISQRVEESPRRPFHLKIAPWVIERTANGQKAEFFVVLTDQADLSGAINLATKAEKGRYVYEELRNKSQTTQRPILQWLRERGIEHRSFYIVNAILVKGSREIAEALAARPDVARIEGNPHIRNSLPESAAFAGGLSLPDKPETVEPNITYTHAPDVWALGFRGQGITVGGADTGQRWTHNALKPQYRGWDGVTADHDYNWHDAIHDSIGNPCGNDSPFPCDDNGHGTHTIGTAIGDDGMGNQIGMAPLAKWIGCRNLDQGNGTPARYLECMQWFLAPYPIGGGQGDPLKAPAVDVLGSLTPADLSRDAFPFMTWQDLTVGDVPARALQVTFTGEHGWELYASTEYGAAALGRARRGRAAARATCCGYRALESLRLEMGYRVWSTDLTPETNPYEAGLGFCVKLDKPGGFVGAEALREAKAAGLARKLCCLTLDNRREVVLGSEPVRVGGDGGQVVGRITSGGLGYTSQASIAYAYLPDRAHPRRHPVDVNLFGTWQPAQVADVEPSSPAAEAVTQCGAKLRERGCEFHR